MMQEEQRSVARESYSGRGDADRDRLRDKVVRRNVLLPCCRDCWRIVCVPDDYCGTGVAIKRMA